LFPQFTVIQLEAENESKDEDKARLEKEKKTLNDKVRSLESQLADWTTRCTTLERRLTHALDELQNLAHRGTNGSATEDVAESQQDLRAELTRERDKSSSYELKLQVLEDKLTKLREEQNGTLYYCVTRDRVLFVVSESR
jgi:chromosome segregation ATPase